MGSGKIQIRLLGIAIFRSAVEKIDCSLLMV
jgi:hypothetical protein